MNRHSDSGWWRRREGSRQALFWGTHAAADTYRDCDLLGRPLRASVVACQHDRSGRGLVSGIEISDKGSQVVKLVKNMRLSLHITSRFG